MTGFFIHHSELTSGARHEAWDIRDPLSSGLSHAFPGPLLCPVSLCVDRSPCTLELATSNQLENSQSEIPLPSIPSATNYSLKTVHFNLSLPRFLLESGNCPSLPPSPLVSSNLISEPENQWKIKIRPVSPPCTTPWEAPCWPLKGVGNLSLTPGAFLPMPPLRPPSPLEPIAIPPFPNMN